MTDLMNEDGTPVVPDPTAVPAGGMGGDAAVDPMADDAETSPVGDSEEGVGEDLA